MVSIRPAAATKSGTASWRSLWLPLMIGLLSAPGASAAPPDFHAGFSCTFDDNVTHAQDGGAKLSDRSCSADLSHPYIFPLAEHWRTVLAGTLGGEISGSYRGLNHLSEAIRGELQYRSSAEFGTPTFSFFAKLAADQYQSWMRDGYRYAAGISMRQDLTDRIRFSGSATHNERRANSAVFDNGNDSMRINLDYTPRLEDTIYLGGEYRHGDLVISAPEGWSTNNPGAYVLDDAFPGMDIYSFRFGGATTIATLGYNLKTGSRSALDFSWQQARSAVNYRTSSLNNVTAHYVTNQYSIAYLLRF